ncbi:MAG: cysS2 [Candidatus Saccharibacteria bacterium]|nr:cysS2 [Candidatus Saccharibacteria bacterium]
MTVRLHNTMTRTVEEFQPIGGIVKLFVCGPTVYDFSHLGHAKTYVQFDVLARMLRAHNYEVTYLQNITNIDDKILVRAAERDMDWMGLADQFYDEYLTDMTVLNNTSVDRYAKATDYIDDIVRQVTVLFDKGHAYEIPGDGIYFEIATFPEYGKLSGRHDVEQNDAQSRIDDSPDKRGWNDFCLWKFSRAGEPSWDAPFGSGRPGWHIEDTAITEHHFGPQYDIHGGAIDLIFPHHEAELTQMESASGKVPFVKHWVHSGFLTVDGEKMSKSLGNFSTIREILDNGTDPMAIRLYMLQSHYRSPVNFTLENLGAAKNRLDNWRSLAVLRHQLHDTIRADSHGYLDDSEASFAAAHQTLLGALADDLNTPEALKLIDETFSGIVLTDPRQLHQPSFVTYLELIDDVLGLQLLKSTPDIDDESKQLLIERNRARDEQQWDRSDELRKDLEARNIAVRDSIHGTIWSYITS